VDIERIEYAHQNSVNADKEQLFKEALEHIYNQYNKLPEAMEAGYMLAVWWREKGDAYDPLTGTEMDKNALREAANIAGEVAKKFPSSEGGIHAIVLLQELNRPLLQIQVEKVNTIGEPFRAKVSYKNTGSIFLRLITVDDVIEKNLNNRNIYEDALIGKDCHNQNR
jgi:hypothetical protein